MLNLILFVAIAFAMWFGVSPRIGQLAGCFLMAAGIAQTQIFRPGEAALVDTQQLVKNKSKRQGRNNRVRR